MNLINAIEALESDDLAVLADAIDICKEFQSANGFDIDFFIELSESDDPKFRLFAYKS